MTEPKRVVTREEDPVAYNCGCKHMGDEGRCFACVAAIRASGIAEGRRMEREAIVAWLRGWGQPPAHVGPHELGRDSFRMAALDAIERGEHEKGAGE